MKLTHSNIRDEDSSDALDEELDNNSDEVGVHAQREFDVAMPDVGNDSINFSPLAFASISRARVQQLIEQNCVAVTGLDRNPRMLKASGKAARGRNGHGHRTSRRTCRCGPNLKPCLLISSMKMPLLPSSISPRA